jgi:preprotein translocase subunit SecY
VLETIKSAWKIPELRKKLLYTLLIIVIFRIGSVIPAPFLDTSVVSEWMGANASDGNFLNYLDTLTGGALSKATIFSLSITPFINASIIVQLLTYALPPLERLQKEGTEGRKTLNKISAFVALFLSIIMALAYYLTMRSASAVKYSDLKSFEGIFCMIVIMLVFIAGSMLIVWMGNQVNDKGIGNGVSIILFAGIIARGPSDVIEVVNLAKDEPNPYVFVAVLLLVIYVAMITLIVFMNEAERRIPIQYAKRVVGRKQYGGQNTHIPIKVCMSGVMPIIFAMAFMSLPSTIGMFFPASDDPTTFWQKFYAGFLNFFSYTSPWYAILYFILIIAFNYFYVSMQYNPVEIANSLRQNNGGIPGIRPGKPTSDYIQRVLSKITIVGAFFLGIIAIFPIFMSMADSNLSGLAMGGTSILIVVNVALETVRTLESQMMMRNHKGFLE